MLIKLRKLSLTLLVHRNLKCASLSTSAYKEDKIKIGKWDINYLKVGNGPHAVLCMPGILGSIWTDFRPQVEGLDREKFTVVAWDPPGYGKSRPPDRDISLNVVERDADYGYELMKALNLSKFSLLGWSFGSWCCFTMAAKHPDAVENLVVWGAFSHLSPHNIEGLKKLRHVNDWAKPVREHMVKMYGEDTFAKYVEDWYGALVYSYENNINVDHLLKDVKCPTLILSGEKDPMTSNAHVEFLCEQIKNSRVHVYPEGKHNIHLAYSADFNKRVEEFLLSSQIDLSN